MAGCKTRTHYSTVSSIRGQMSISAASALDDLKPRLQRAIIISCVLDDSFSTWPARLVGTSRHSLPLGWCRKIAFGDQFGRGGE